jgi:hypothetical protein
MILGAKNKIDDFSSGPPTCFAQKPINSHSATKRTVEILNAKYEKADLPAIIRENCSHLKASDREKLLSVLLRFELLFDGILGD